MDTWKEVKGQDWGGGSRGAATQLQVRPQGGTVELIVNAGDPHSNESLNTDISPEGCRLEQGSSLQLKTVPGEELGVIHQWSIFPLQCGGWISQALYSIHSAMLPFSMFHSSTACQ